MTFVLVKGLLVTIRYDELQAFSVFAERGAGAGRRQRRRRPCSACWTRWSSAWPRCWRRTATRWRPPRPPSSSGPRASSFEALLTDLARAQSLTSHDPQQPGQPGAAAVSFAALAPEIAGDPECAAHLKSLQRDAQSLTEHAGFQSSHIAFLLDAALGLINIEQNGIIKFFSVVAVIFMPPTLVASIYGMNFHHMPELSWPLGYPMALGLMVVSAILPVLWFKRARLVLKRPVARLRPFNRSLSAPAAC